MLIILQAGNRHRIRDILVLVERISEKSLGAIFIWRLIYTQRQYPYR